MELYYKRKNEKELKIHFGEKNRKLPKRKEDKNFLFKFYKEKLNMNYYFLGFQKEKNYLNNEKIIIEKTKFYINLKTYSSLLILYIIMLINYKSFLCKCEYAKRNALSKLSEITLKTYGTGPIKIFSDSFFKNYNQCQVYINDEPQNETKNEYDFNYHNNGINNIRIAWKIKVSSIESMFSGCSNITEIDLSKFETFNLTEMGGMFSGCSSLISVDLSSIDTTNVTTMNGMFSRCSKLISLDLSNFDTSQVTITAGMFYNCTNLEIINFKILNFSKNRVSNAMFDLVNKNLIICFKNNESKSLNGKLNKSIHCNYFSTKNMSICYSNESAFNNRFICDICGKNYIIKNNTQNNVKAPYINCFAEIEGYYLDEMDWSYKQCYISCKVCKINGDNNTNNCIICKEEYKYEINITNSSYKNCYKNNPFSDIIQLDINKNNFESIILNLINEININDLINGNDKKII